MGSRLPPTRQLPRAIGLCAGRAGHRLATSLGFSLPGPACGPLLPSSRRAPFLLSRRLRCPAGRGLPWCEDLGPTTRDNDSSQLLFHFFSPRPLPLPELSAATRRLTRKGLLGRPPPTPAWFPKLQRPPALFGWKIAGPRHLFFLSFVTRALIRNILQRRRGRKVG